MELLDVVNQYGVPTGDIVEREEAHRLGICHRTSHVWVLRRVGKGVELLLQKRSYNKDSHPGCYDISSAGHIPAGAGFVESALRELKEELGIDASADELFYCGQRSIKFSKEFNGKPFADNQVSNVYVLWRDIDPDSLILQREEVSEVRWMEYCQCVKSVQENLMPNCISLEELEMLKKAF